MCRETSSETRPQEVWQVLGIPHGVMDIAEGLSVITIVLRYSLCITFGIINTCYFKA